MSCKHVSSSMCHQALVLQDKSYRPNAGRHLFIFSQVNITPGATACCSGGPWQCRPLRHLCAAGHSQHSQRGNNKTMSCAIRAASEPRSSLRLSALHSKGFVGKTSVAQHTVSSTKTAASDSKGTALSHRAALPSKQCELLVPQAE